MNPDLCASTQASFSDYLDGASTGREMQQIAAHLSVCSHCTGEFAAARAVQETLSSLGPSKPPPELAMQLRLAISHESSRTVAVQLDRLHVRWNNLFRPLLLQASAGFAGTVAFVGGVMLLLGMVASPEPVMANDEPLGAVTAPHFLYSVTQPRAIQTARDETIVVEADVNARGEVYDFNIVSGSSDPAVRTQIVEQLLSSVFQPASVFGGPARGRVVLTFSGISVHA